MPSKKTEIHGLLVLDIMPYCVLRHSVITRSCRCEMLSARWKRDGPLNRTKPPHPTVRMMSKEKLAGRTRWLVSLLSHTVPRSCKVTWIPFKSTWQSHTQICTHSCKLWKGYRFHFLWLGRRKEKEWKHLASFNTLTSCQCQSLSQVMFEWRIKAEDPFAICQLMLPTKEVKLYLLIKLTGRQKFVWFVIDKWFSNLPGLN